ncbi:FAD-dependent thymidylate synthase [Caldanaerobacter subterraneus]|uniref:Thymidylate synthase ThyX n=1 Tax=Caldanaerobacter subterraneus TaxID=911092 RepID=A0A4R2KBK3_9THEO|nr:FAD-dependent thymidylate synthase [Caldanaerobacter subterraneus]TCO67566.1 thymidylate synthase ThyX [Caldanaerobacter subterraneus]
MKMRKLTPEEERLLENFVTDVYGPVYFIHSLPEFIIPPINSKVSRRDTSWRLNILESLTDGDLNITDYIPKHNIPLEKAIQKAKEFHEKWVERFGHSSIAEQHLMHLCVEDVSRLLSGDIELMNRRPAFIEWSQRYQKSTRDKVVIPPELEEKPDLKEKFLKVWQTSYDAYEKLVEVLTNYLAYTEEKKEGESEEKFLKRISKIAFEDARYALILATRTSFAVALNALDLQDIVRKLFAHPTKEAKLLAERIVEQGEKIAPSTLRHLTPTPYQLEVNEKLKEIVNTLEFEEELAPSSEDVVLIDYTGKDTEFSPLDIVVAHILFTYSGKNFETVKEKVKRMAEEEKERIIKKAVEGIGEFDHLIEAFRSVRFKFQLKISEASWHQLLRHRTILFDYSEPTIENGFVIPPNIEKANASDILVDAIKASEELFVELKEKLPQVSSYVVTNAHKRLVVMNADLWAFDHFANLRCTNEAQWDIRNTSFKMLELMKEVAPQLTFFMARRKKA